MTDMTPDRALHRNVYVTIAPHLRSVFADETRKVTDSVVAVFAEWLRDAADGYGQTPWADGAVAVADALADLADELDPPKGD